MAEPIDVVLDDDGLWTTHSGEGQAVMRPMPGPQGVQRKRLWQVPIDAALPRWLADHAPSATDRTVALAHLCAATITAADQMSIPVARSTQHWTFEPVPDPDQALILEQAWNRCEALGLVASANPRGVLQDLVVQIADARRQAVTSPLPEVRLTRAEQALLQRWAARVIARSAANARLALSITAPTETDPLWTLSSLAIRLDEPTTRLPWATAGPEPFGAAPSAWERFRDAETEALTKAWGRPLPDVRAPVTRGGAELTDAQMVQFVDQVADRVNDAGFDVMVPGGLLRPVRVRRRMRSGPGTGTLAVTGLGLEAEVLIDGEVLTAKEITALAASKSELVAVKGRWLRLDPADVRRITALADRLRHGVTASDLLADEAFDGVELDASSLLPAGLRPARRVSPPESVQATLRPYQRTGFEWLTWLADNQLGGILADDMGLGKTLQVLTWISADHPGPTLVVCPVTLVDTWVRQAATFTPTLRVQAYHGSDRTTVDADIVVTTYGLLARDEALRAQQWHRVVLDEAQAIKNPDTHAARSARALKATQRLAVTGTPVENHLGDLWSLLAFAQPGLLPRRKAFMDRYASAGSEELSRLRAVVSPFILRRVKTDPGILPDLPDREVIRDDCTLTREQIGAYEAVVSDLMGALEQLRQAAGAPDAAPLRRRATVLASISRLKQICVHPALLTESRRGLAQRSGKINRLVDLCTQIVDEGQAVVIFTQFASFVPDLADHLRQRLAVDVLTLTGSDSRAARAATVTRFSHPDGPPILLASLKAGGTGLTLVRANHVIHLDRWWNPAVEDQASDRVWRIGQNQKVSVHVLVCPGTLEERIDETLRSKRSLAASIVRSTETAVTELDDSQLADLVTLVRDEVLQ